MFITHGSHGWHFRLSEICRMYKMKRKPPSISLGKGPMSVDEQVRTEIKTFLLALRSYPDRFAKDPRITFQEYCCSLMQATRQEPRHHL